LRVTSMSWISLMRLPSRLTWHRPAPLAREISLALRAERDTLQSPKSKVQGLPGPAHDCTRLEILLYSDLLRFTEIWSDLVRWDTEQRSHNQGGVRPSSGAATPEPLSASHLSAAVRTSCDAAPEDGRTPGLSEKSSRIESRLDDWSANVSSGLPPLLPGVQVVPSCQANEINGFVRFKSCQGRAQVVSDWPNVLGRRLIVSASSAPPGPKRV